MNAPTLSPPTVATMHPVRRALIEAALKLNALQPTKIVAEPDMADAKALQQDIDAVCAIVDPILVAIGLYAQSHFGRMDQSLFTDCLRCATDGQSTFEIEQAAKLYIGERGEGAAENATEFRRTV